MRAPPGASRANIYSRATRSGQTRRLAETQGDSITLSPAPALRTSTEPAARRGVSEMIELKKRVGRLLTIRMLPPLTEQEWDQFEAEILKIVKMAPSQVIFCIDLRGATVFTDKIAERCITSMRTNSPKV